MTPGKPYRKFQAQESSIRRLKEQNSRFNRVYSEYETMSDELWDLETSERMPVPDDFRDAVQQQTDYLEEEISNWLQQEAGEPAS